MKNKITGIISLALIAIGLLCSSALAIKNVIMLSGIIQPDPIEGVLQRGQYVEGDLYVHNANIYRIDHSINLIPTGTERFYVAFDDENDTVYYIRANKKLAEKASDNPMQHIKGKVAKANSDSKQKLSEYGNNYVSEGYNLGYYGEVLFIDTQVFQRSLLNVGAIALLLIAGAILFLSPTGRKPANTFTAVDHILAGASLAMILIGGLILFYIILFVF